MITMMLLSRETSFVILLLLCQSTRISYSFCPHSFYTQSSYRPSSDKRYAQNESQDYEKNDEIEYVEEEDDPGYDKPKYRSKLQRLNQVQNNSKNVSRMKKKTKLKQRKRSVNDSTFSSSLGIESIQDEPPKLFSDAGMPIDEDYAIDSFLRGEYDRPFSDEAAAPLPNHKPSEIVEIALTALRDLDIPTTDHGAAVFMRFCAPLSRFDRWGGNISGAISPWKAILRGSLTPTMLAKRLRASDEFSVLLDWEQLDVTEGTKAMPNEILGYESTIAFVNAALFFGDGTEPSMCQFTLKMFNGVWLIDSAVMNKRELFMEYDS